MNFMDWLSHFENFMCVKKFLIKLFLFGIADYK